MTPQNTNIHDRIQKLLEETDDAFKACAGCMNTDYAAFASMRLSEFKALLEKPELTGKELRRMLRQGNQNQRTKDPEGCWASFVADYIATSGNENTENSISYGLDKIYKRKP